MDETWVVYDTAPQTILQWLDELVTVARTEQQSNPHRSQQPLAGAGALDLHALPLPVRSHARHAGAIYARLPTPDEPLGYVLLLALIEPVQPEVLRVELATDPRFPLLGDEVRWLFRHRFPHNARGAGGRRTGLLLWINGLSEDRFTGAPVLPCNVWLEEQLAHLPNPADPEARRRLFTPWLTRYRALRGCDPADPIRSFRAAVQGCEHRLRRRALHGKAPPARRAGRRRGLE